MSSSPPYPVFPQGEPPHSPVQGRVLLATALLTLSLSFSTHDDDYGMHIPAHTYLTRCKSRSPTRDVARVCSILSLSLSVWCSFFFFHFSSSTPRVRDYQKTYGCVSCCCCFTDLWILEGRLCGARGTRAGGISSPAFKEDGSIETGRTPQARGYSEFI